jgi:hypothetical protein
MPDKHLVFLLRVDLDEMRSLALADDLGVMPGELLKLAGELSSTWSQSLPSSGHAGT